MNQIELCTWRRNYTEALDAFDHATRESTTIAEIWNNKGLTLAALERYQERWTASIRH